MSEALHIVCPHCDAVNRVPRERLAEKPSCGSCHKDLFTARPLELDSKRFHKHITRSDVPVLVDFWAAWCGPCKMMAPAFQEAAARLEPNLRLAKVDTDAAQDVAARYNIRSIPTLILFRNGAEVARQPGAMDARSIVAWAESHAGY